MAIDSFKRKAKALDSPAYDAFVIDPDVSEELSVVTRGIYIGESGNLYCRLHGTIHTSGNANICFRNVVAGTILPIRATHVWANNYTDPTQNTTAGELVGLF